MSDKKEQHLTASKKWHKESPGKDEPPRATVYVTSTV
jgi:hypothetical protein